MVECLLQGPVTLMSLSDEKVGPPAGACSSSLGSHPPRERLAMELLYGAEGQIVTAGFRADAGGNLGSAEADAAALAR